MGDVLAEALAALEAGDVDALELLMREHGHRAPFKGWVRNQLEHYGANLVRELARRSAPLGFDALELTELVDEIEQAAHLYQHSSGTVCPDFNLFGEPGELEAARVLSEGHPRAEMLCELAAVLAAAAVDVATAVDDAEANAGVARALDVLEHLRDTLARGPRT